MANPFDLGTEPSSGHDVTQGSSRDSAADDIFGEFSMGRDTADDTSMFDPFSFSFQEKEPQKQHKPAPDKFQNQENNSTDPRFIPPTLAKNDPKKRFKPTNRNSLDSGKNMLFEPENNLCVQNNNQSNSSFSSKKIEDQSQTVPKNTNNGNPRKKPAINSDVPALFERDSNLKLKQDSNEEERNKRVHGVISVEEMDKQFQETRKTLTEFNELKGNAYSCLGELSKTQSELRKSIQNFEESWAKQTKFCFKLKQDYVGTSKLMASYCSKIVDQQHRRFELVQFIKTNLFGKN